MRRFLLPIFVAVSALAVSASAAFYSVSGLSKLFAGASLAVIIMAGSLEFSKLVLASFLYQYWTTVNKVLRLYFSIALVILVVITSMGIYGFLSAAYQGTYLEYNLKNSEIGYVDEKIGFFASDVERYDNQIKDIDNSINSISTKAETTQVRDTLSVTGFREVVLTRGRDKAYERIDNLELRRNTIEKNRATVLDSLTSYRGRKLQLEQELSKTSELGPLKYLSELTGYSMDKVINVLLLVIVFVFDPLAVCLVVGANFAFSKINRIKLPKGVVRFPDGSFGRKK